MKLIKKTTPEEIYDLLLHNRVFGTVTYELNNKRNIIEVTRSGEFYESNDVIWLKFKTLIFFFKIPKRRAPVDLREGNYKVKKIIINLI